MGQKNVKKAVICLEASEMTEAEIIRERAIATACITRYGYEVIAVFDNKTAKMSAADGARYIEKTLKTIAVADTVYFDENWENSCVCAIQHWFCIEFHVDIGRYSPWA
jgi:hypothetical protein